MSAETLREAAALMRKRAEAATPGPWWGGGGKGPVRRKQQVALVGVANMRGQGEKGCIAVLAGLNGHRADDAEHIASWHPAVALAVAELFENLADHWGQVGPMSRVGLLKIATAYLGATP